ncbi:SCO family protein [Thalassorhabdus alkalitolerans]|uniref:SCO family protein n=1 Tax=Thalassorhabdus alkalitolerans TaxID=2282697 RepID=A0ABW0YR00_9BACI
MRNTQLLIFMGMIFLLSGCGWLYASPAAESEYDISEADMQVEDFEYTNQHGESFGLSELEGDYWLASMIFTRCPSVCPLMTPNKLNLQGELEEEGVPVQIVSFTVDPEFDTPERLLNYGENYNVDFSNWNFLTGYSDEEIEEFAQSSFRSVVQKVPEEEDIVHATSFFLVDGEGQVIRKYDGLDNDTSPIVEDLKYLTGS